MNAAEKEKITKEQDLSQVASATMAMYSLKIASEIKETPFCTISGIVRRQLRSSCCHKQKQQKRDVQQEFFKWKVFYCSVLIYYLYSLYMCTDKKFKENYATVLLVSSYSCHLVFVGDFKLLS